MAQIMEIFLNYLLLRGKFLTTIAAEAVHESIRKCMHFKRKISVEYNSATQIILPFENMWEYINHNSQQYKCEGKNFVVTSEVHYDLCKGEENQNPSPSHHKHKNSTSEKSAKKMENLAPKRVRRKCSQPKKERNVNEDRVFDNIQAILKSQEFLFKNIIKLLDMLEKDEVLSSNGQKLSKIKRKLEVCTNALSNTQLHSKIINNIIEEEITRCRFRHGEGKTSAEISLKVPRPQGIAAALDNSNKQAHVIKVKKNEETASNKKTKVAKKKIATKVEAEKKFQKEEIPDSVNEKKNEVSTQTKITNDPAKLLKRANTDPVIRFSAKPKDVEALLNQTQVAVEASKNLIQTNHNHFNKFEDTLWHSLITMKFLSLKTDYFNMCKCAFYNKRQFIATEAIISRRIKEDEEAEHYQRFLEVSESMFQMIERKLMFEMVKLELSEMGPVSPTEKIILSSEAVVPKTEKSNLQIIERKVMMESEPFLRWQKGLESSKKLNLSPDKVKKNEDLKSDNQVKTATVAMIAKTSKTKGENQNEKTISKNGNSWNSEKQKLVLSRNLSDDFKNESGQTKFQNKSSQTNFYQKKAATPKLKKKLSAKNEEIKKNTFIKREEPSHRVSFSNITMKQEQKISDNSQNLQFSRNEDRSLSGKTSQKQTKPFQSVLTEKKKLELSGKEEKASSCVKKEEKLSEDSEKSKNSSRTILNYGKGEAKTKSENYYKNVMKQEQKIPDNSQKLQFYENGDVSLSGKTSQKQTQPFQGVSTEKKKFELSGKEEKASAIIKKEERLSEDSEKSKSSSRTILNYGEDEAKIKSKNHYKNGMKQEQKIPDNSQKLQFSKNEDRNLSGKTSQKQKQLFQGVSIEKKKLELSRKEEKASSSVKKEEKLSEDSEKSKNSSRTILNYGEDKAKIKSETHYKNVIEKNFPCGKKESVEGSSKFQKKDMQVVDKDVLEKDERQAMAEILMKQYSISTSETENANKEKETIVNQFTKATTMLEKSPKKSSPNVEEKSKKEISQKAEEKEENENVRKSKENLSLQTTSKNKKKTDALELKNEADRIYTSEKVFQELEAAIRTVHIFIDKSPKRTLSKPIVKTTTENKRRKIDETTKKNLSTSLLFAKIKQQCIIYNDISQDVKFNPEIEDEIENRFSLYKEVKKYSLANEKTFLKTGKQKNASGIQKSVHSLATQYKKELGNGEGKKSTPMRRTTKNAMKRQQVKTILPKISKETEEKRKPQVKLIETKEMKAAKKCMKETKRYMSSASKKGTYLNYVAHQNINKSVRKALKKASSEEVHCVKWKTEDINIADILRS